MVIIIIYYLCVFSAGLFIGSFLNVVADRLVSGEPVAIGRSRCDHCKKTLQPKNLIPLLSFVMQGGKCSFCGHKLSFYYPFSEILTGVVLVFSAYYTGLFSNWSLSGVVGFLYVSIILCLYAVMLLADAKYYVIPNIIVFTGIGVVLLFILGNLVFDIYTSYRAVTDNPLGEYLIKAGFLTNQIVWLLKPFLATLVSSICISLFFWFLIVITKGRGMGSGDVRLGFLIGLFNGFPFNILSIFLGFVFGSVVSLVLVVLKKKTLKDTIPFGPFLILGSVVSFVWGAVILNWYLGLLS